MNRLRKIQCCVVTTAIALATAVGSALIGPQAQAAQTGGTAPYVNQWAVAGPYSDQVVEGSARPVVPAIGTSLEDQGNNEKSTWQYFDDRIFNRNYDDYNDLMGYFDVKQGQATTDKWVLAASYVYSPTTQDVQWQVGGSGVYRLFANDAPVGRQDSVANRVSKNGKKYPVQLKQGWNKLLIEIQHKNPGKNKNFLGFYTRLCDGDGNLVPDLTNSVTGPNTSDNRLSVVTTGLSVDRDAFKKRNANTPANDYPSNTLPYAYDENPYVKMVATIDGKPNTSSIAPQAAPFTFQAAGGAPGYKWTVADGQLPPGLELAADGHIEGKVSDGAQGKTQKDYTFTLKVTDAQGATATKQYTITVKKNPVDWFIDGKMSALSHTTGTMPNLYDPNFNYDEWAQRAKEMGMTMLSTESIQNTIYYWPSPNANLTPSDSNKMYKYNALQKADDGTWHVKDRVQQAKEAAERYGLKFGVYLSSLYEGSDILESDIQNLVARYNPWYVFADGGPESYSNTDVAWSSARNYNDRVLIDANPNAQTGDQDITLHERPFWNGEPYNEGGWGDGVLPQGRKVAHEEWNDPYTTALDVWTIYANGNERDDWSEAAKELINQYGHGYVMNYDSSITVTRGMDNLSSNLDNTNIFSMVPVSSQQLSDMRGSIVHWMDNGSGPDLRESLYGTTPYTMDYTRKPGWYTDPQKAIAHGQGPDWGYAMARDQYTYMHMVKNQISGVPKSGFSGQDQMKRIGPFDYKVDAVEWLNKGTSLPFTTERDDGKYYIDIDTSKVTADPIDTVIKIRTKSPVRDYTMSSVKLFSSQTSTKALQLRAECYMNGYTNVFAPAKLTYTSDNERVATVGGSGRVTPVGDGSATIKVTATYDDGVNAPQVKTDTYPVKVRGGAIAADLPLVGVNMFTQGASFWGQFATDKDLPVTFKGFTQKGGAVDILDASKIKYHYATVDGRRDNAAGKIVVDEVPADQSPFVVEGNTMKFTGKVTKPTMYSYWADITVDGKTYTSTRNFLTLTPDANVAQGITPKVSTDGKHAKTLSDGTINDASGGNADKWVAPAGDEAPSITYDLRKVHDLTRVNVFFNHHMPNADNVTYYNVPKKVKIEYSEDGATWTTGHEASTLSGAGLPTAKDTRAVPQSDTTLYGWEQEGLYYNYPVDPDRSSVKARYVRVSFPGGGQNGSPVDVLEVRAFSAGD
ncbi:putative Ig domain-containing protein [Streptomyces antnestii]|uniref:putative Ig domain-containing protein n=1 Tax=Streptomyces antnestii TaxID=2494256 RepID=UPI001CB93505|nr:putative Ig domain-containing protein [Streptomyces sp. San01]